MAETAVSSSCALAGVCSGCEWIGEPYRAQLEKKAEAVRELWRRHALPQEALARMGVRSFTTDALRDRADLVVDATSGTPRLGFYELHRREVVDVDKCPQLSPPLQQWLREFRADLPPIRRGSVRLRVGLGGIRGAWLDFANTDIKSLLDEGSWLDGLASKAIVEVGQRRKRLIRKGARWGLGDAELAPWFCTYIDSRAVPLYGTIGTFTQTGMGVNRLLVEEMLAAVGTDRPGRWVELGAGNGNFTLPLAHRVGEVEAVEQDALAVQGATLSAQEAGLSGQVRFIAADYRADAVAHVLPGAAGVVADPPRSGLSVFLPRLEACPADARPPRLVYLSCNPESFVADAAGLYGLGYRLASVVGVDQFPQTPHLELVARFERV